MGRTHAAILTAALVTVIVSGRRTELWALIVAVLCVLDAPLSRHWFQPPTSTDRLWQRIDLVFPSIAYIAATCIKAPLRGDRTAPDATPAAVWFAYSPVRKGEHPQAHLSHFPGTLQANGYAGFDAVYETGRIQEAVSGNRMPRKHSRRGSPHSVYPSKSVPNFVPTPELAEASTSGASPA